MGKKVQRNNIIHTNRLKGHQTTDLIVVYLKYEDVPTLNTQEKPDRELYFPQWICADMVSETSGIWLPMPKLVACTYEEMKKLAINMLKNNVTIRFKRVKFYYSPTILTVNGMSPFE